MNISLTWEISIYFVINLLSLYTVICLFKTLMVSKEQISKVYHVIAYMSYLVINSITFWLADTPLINIFIQIVLLSVLAYFYQERIRNKIMVIIFISSFMVGLEVITPYLYSILSGDSLIKIMMYDASRVYVTVLSRLIPLFIVKIFQTNRTERQQNLIFDIVHSLKMIFIPICSIFIMHCIHQIAIHYTSKIEWMVISSILVLVVINLAFYYLPDKIKEMEKTKYENNLLKAQNEYYIKQQNDLKNNYEMIGAIRHDLKHQLLYIKNKLDENTDEAIKCLQVELGQLIDSVRPNDINVYSNNEIINIILNYKLDNIIKNSIKLDVKIGLRDEILINDKILYTILGNALDNAIENYSPQEGTSDKIIIRIYEEHNNLYIKISNPYSQKLKFKNNMPVTNKKEPFMHGIGLKSIRNMVESNNGQMRISFHKNIFVLEIILFEGIKYKSG